MHISPTLLPLLSLLPLTSAANPPPKKPGNHPHLIPAGKDLKCDYQDGPRINKHAVKKCWDAYRTNNWHSKTCGGKFFTKDRHDWPDVEGCYDVCAECVTDAINKGKAGVKCDAYGGESSHCWIGYR